MACQLFNQAFTIGAESGNLILSGGRISGDPVISRINNINITPDNNSPIYITDKKSGRRLKCIYSGSNGTNQGVQYKQERVYSYNQYGTLSMNWGCSLDIPTELRDKVIADPSKSYGAHSAENVSILFYDATNPPGYYGRYSMFRTFPVTQQIIQNYYKRDGSYRLTNTFFIMINSKNYADHQPINTPQYKASVSYDITYNIGRFYFKVEFLEEIEFESIAAGLYPLNLPPLT